MLLAGGFGAKPQFAQLNASPLGVLRPQPLPLKPLLIRWKLTWCEPRKPITMRLQHKCPKPTLIRIECGHSRRAIKKRDCHSLCVAVSGTCVHRNYRHAVRAATNGCQRGEFRLTGIGRFAGIGERQQYGRPAYSDAQVIRELRLCALDAS